MNDKIREALGPCPFCGGPATWMDVIQKSGEQFICCDNDECFGPHTTATDEDAIVQWNTRAALATPPAQAEIGEEYTEARINEIANSVLDVPIDPNGITAADLLSDDQAALLGLQVGLVLSQVVEMIRLRASNAGEGWQLMTTAPKDGERYIFGFYDGEVWRACVCRWDGERFTAGRVKHENIILDIDRRSTHWRPLPTPPQKDTRDQ